MSVSFYPQDLSYWEDDNIPHCNFSNSNSSVVLFAVGLGFEVGSESNSDGLWGEIPCVGIPAVRERIGDLVAKPETLWGLVTRRFGFIVSDWELNSLIDRLEMLDEVLSFSQIVGKNVCWG